MKKLIAHLISAATLCLWLNSTATAALTLDFTGQPPVPVPMHIPGGANPDAAAIAAAFGITAADVGANLYKQNAGGVEEKSLAGNYTTTFGDPQYSGPITITWNGGAFANATFLLVKDGNQGSYVWDLRGGLWNGQDTINIIGNLFPNPQSPGEFKDVSHVEFYGTPVPEPTTVIAGALLLLPFAVSTIRRFRKS